MELMPYLERIGCQLTAVEAAERNNELSNWTYLSISFQSSPPSLQTLAELLYCEVRGRRRKHIIERLYTKWLKSVKQDHMEELKNEACESQPKGKGR